MINLELNCLTRVDYIPSRNPLASAMESLDTMVARTSLPLAFAWSHAYSFATSVANFFAMPALPDAAAERSSEADDDNETCAATGAAGATTVNEGQWFFFCESASIPG